jgi:hypothetical protein
MYVTSSNGPLPDPLLYQAASVLALGSGPCAFLAGFMGLRRREQPKYPAWVGIVCGALYLGLFLLFFVYAMGVGGVYSGGL